MAGSTQLWVPFAHSSTLIQSRPAKPVAQRQAPSFNNGVMSFISVNWPHAYTLTLLTCLYPIMSNILSHHSAEEWQISLTKQWFVFFGTLVRLRKVKGTHQRRSDMFSQWSFINSFVLSDPADVQIILKSLGSEQFAQQPLKCSPKLKPKGDPCANTGDCSSQNKIKRERKKVTPPHLDWWREMSMNW